MRYREILRELKNIKKKGAEYSEPDEENPGKILNSVFLGLDMSLDPCGKYHCILSPNDTPPECIKYWENLDRAAKRIGCWITSGEGDPCDILMQWLTPIEEDDRK